MGSDPVWRSRKEIFLLLSSALCSFAVAVMSKAISTDLSSFSSLDWHPWIRATTQVSQWATKLQIDGASLLLLPARAAATLLTSELGGSLSHQQTLQTSYSSALYGTLRLNNSLPAAGRFKTEETKKQRNTNGLIPSSRLFWKRRGSSNVAHGGASQFHQTSANPCMCFPTSQKPPCKWWNVVRNRIANVYWLLLSFPTEFWGVVCLFLVWSLKAGKEFTWQKKWNKKQEQNTINKKPTQETWNIFIKE